MKYTSIRLSASVLGYTYNTRNLKVEAGDIVDWAPRWADYNQRGQVLRVVEKLVKRVGKREFVKQMVVIQPLSTRYIHPVSVLTKPKFLALVERYSDRNL